MAKTRNADWMLYGSMVALLIIGLAFCFSASSVVGVLRSKIVSENAKPAENETAGAVAGELQSTKPPGSVGHTGKQESDKTSWLNKIREKNEWYYIARQLGATALGLFFVVLLSRMDFRRWNSPAWAFVAMGSATAMVLLAAFVDTRAHRWLRLPIIQIQPSEFAKPALVLFCAYFIAKRMNAINDRHTVLPASIVVGILGAAVMWGDLGTGVVLMVAAATLFFVAGLRWRYIALALAIAFLGTGASIATKSYRLTRAVAFVDPELKLVEKYAPEMAATYRSYLASNNRDPNYQVRQSLVTVGSGGLTGLGFMESKQKMLFLPESHTDFIFAVVAEEGGLLGAVAVLGLYLLIAWRGLRVFFRSDNDFGRYLALGITVLFLFQALVNISVVLAIAPTKGLPLPLISYGGSSMLSTLVCFGMLLSVSERST